MRVKRSPGNGSGFRPQKRLGQHFLLDQRVITKMITCARFQASDLVLEIGPGKGALTLPLARLAGRVIAVEKDGQLAGLLKEKLAKEGITNVTLVHNDILKFDFQEIDFAFSSKFKVIGNLPYNISTPFLERLIENRDRVSRAVLMFQSEIAKRLTASSGNKTYGAMTVLVQYHAHAAPILQVSRNAFFPKPKVDSMVLELDFERPHPNRAIDEGGFIRVVKGAFAHRRKTLLNSLRDVYPHIEREKLFKGIQNCQIDPGARAEALEIDDFICLAASLELTER